MLRVSVRNIRPGMILARPIPQPRDSRTFLLQRDREIPMDLVPRLEQLGVTEVWIRCRDLEFLEDVVDEGLDEQQREIYALVRRNFEAVMSGVAPELDVRHFQESISSLFHLLKTSNCGNTLLYKLDAFDNFLVSHSTNVCYLSLLVGMKLERYLMEERSAKSAREAKDLRLLGLGCLLHDVGKMRIPAGILNKPGRLTSEEMQVMKLHPEYGYNMLAGQVPGAAAQVVLNHHQRWDGTGYPARCDRRTGDALPSLRGKQIPIFCRIATIADMFDAATSKRCYSEAKLPVQVLYELRTWCHGAFDPVVEQAFYETVPPFPLGQMVTLSNGVEAAVVDFNPRCPVRPRVRGLRDPSGKRFADPSLEEIDLACCPDLDITLIDGVDVLGFQMNQQTAEPSLPVFAPA
ncbi:MAG TPA: HD-GYP domain-containing protein [Pirellulales bacterium]|nr:HD-GYP domain-containing protein [Pirellulales bacterium]